MSFSVNDNQSSAQTATSLQGAPTDGTSILVDSVSFFNGGTAGNFRLVEDTGGTPVNLTQPIYLGINESRTMAFESPLMLSADVDLGYSSVSSTTHSVLVTGVGGAAAAAYAPGMMTFDGTDDSYTKTSATTSGNLVTAVARFNRSTFTGTGEVIVEVDGGGNDHRIQLLILSSDSGATARRNKIHFSVENSSGTTICRLVTSSDMNDGANHTLLAAFDGDSGTAVLIVDGVDEDDTGNADRIAPTTGTLASGASSRCGVGAQADNGGSFFQGDIGFSGYRDAYITDGSLFMDGSDPIEQDEDVWSNSGWGAQPLIWNRSGTMVANAGSAGAMTENSAPTTTVGDFYDFPHMTYDGSTGYYTDTTVTPVGNKETVVCSFNIAAFTGGGIARIASIKNDAGSQLLIFAVSSDHATVANRSRIVVQHQNTAGGVVCTLLSNTAVCDGGDHVLFHSYDGDLGTALYYIDGVDEDDTGFAARVLTTGTLGGANDVAAFGARDTGADFVDGQLGFFGMSSTYLTNPLDFMDGSAPKELDTSTWTEWGAQPLYWNNAGTMTSNAGSAGNMTKNGTITGPA